MKKEKEKKPTKPQLLHGKKLFYFFKGLFYFPVKLVFPVKVIARKKNFPKSGRFITVTNHLSWVDVPIVQVDVVKFSHFVGKKEIGKSKFMQFLGDHVGAIYVDRGKADMSAIRSCVNFLKQEEALTIFPEGTRNKVNDEVQEIKGGVTMIAIKGRSPIVPVMIHHHGKPFHKNYVYVAPPFTLRQFYDRRLDKQALAEADEIVYQKMRDAKKYLDEYVRDKRWIKDKIDEKLQRKRNKRLNKKAKLDYKEMLKAKRV